MTVPPSTKKRSKYSGFFSSSNIGPSSHAYETLVEGPWKRQRKRIFVGSNAGDRSHLFPGFHFELGDSSVQIRVRLLKRLDIRLRYLVMARVRQTEPQSFGRPVQASGEFRESSVSGHCIHRQQQEADSMGIVRIDPYRTASRCLRQHSGAAILPGFFTHRGEAGSTLCARPSARA